jgi:hypothetical protein
MPKKYSAKKLALRAENALNANYVLVSEDVLEGMEEVWTNRTRPRESRDALETRLFVTVNYRVSIGSDWVVRRSIFCLAFDEEALNRLRQYSKRASPPLAIKNARRLGKNNAENLLRDLKSQAIPQYIASALSKKTQELRTVAGTSSSSACPVYEFVDRPDYPTDEKRPYEIIDQVYDWCKKSPEEPTESYLGFSQQLSSLTSSLTDPTVASHFPHAKPIKEEQSVLVASYPDPFSLDDNGLRLCLYVVPGSLEPPTKKTLTKAL